MITQSPGNYREMTLVEDDHLRFQIVEDVRFDLIKSTEQCVLINEWTKMMRFSKIRTHCDHLHTKGWKLVTFLLV